ncbi:hypothetical protein [Variovorax soli]|uniref:Uncharacterized protein n=1 Tax=Variovorax soli TaxID=376815 RepID=A0ABU1NF40_9BURK|nr:hypothetical protein [Variovorax soli]MDR6536917.1 hypothetical protein [Variovorax soli]
MNPAPAHAARDHVIAMLTLLPARLGGRWPLDDTSGPDTAAWRIAESMAVTLCIGAQEFTFLHSLEAPLSACLLFESLCGIAPPASKIDCYRKLLAMNRANDVHRSPIYALDPATKKIIRSSAYALDSLDVDMLASEVIEAGLQTMLLREEFALTSEPLPALSRSSLLLQI